MARTVSYRGVKMTYRSTHPTKTEAIKEANRKCVKGGWLKKFYTFRKVKDGYALYTE